MADERVQRRLAAILAADMVGYSRLIGADEEGTIARQKAHRAEMIDPAIASHGGRIVKTMGDGLLVEFPSVVDAVKCAIAIQRAMSEHEADVPEDRRIQYRVGINLGDIVIDGEDILGDGVNVAARLEGEADPGGICISGDAYRQVLGKIEHAFEDLGELALKNIAAPVRAYRLTLSSAPDRPTTGILPLPDKASIAVLPFDNLSGDPEQEFFADGLTEDIITDLSRFPDLVVIARNSSFTYKGRAVKVQDVGRELGVNLVLEGSVRKTSNRVRITAQLIDAANGSHIWAERYDRELVDIFDLQDEITQAIVAVLPGRVATTAAGRLKRKRLGDMAAYDFVLAGKIHHHRFTKDDNIEALRLLGKAIELEPNYATAWAWRACTLGQALDLHYRDDPDTVYRQAIDALEKALELNENDVECHRLLCEVNMEDHQIDQAQLHHDKAFSQNPNDVRLVAQRGELLTWTGKPEEGVVWIKKAIKLDPFGAQYRAHLLGRALYAARRYPEALDAFKQIQSPRHTHIADMAACSAQIGDTTAAEARATDVMRLKPNFSAISYVTELPYREASDRAHHHEGLVKAGLPDN
jgi:adenylate cyclase